MEVEVEVEVMPGDGGQQAIKLQDSQLQTQWQAHCQPPVLEESRKKTRLTETVVDSRAVPGMRVGPC